MHRLLNRGYTQVVDADLSGYFDSTPHAELMKCSGWAAYTDTYLHDGLGLIRLGNLSKTFAWAKA